MGRTDGPCIAVTGATGFIGSILCQRLIQAGFAVRALARTPARGQLLQSLGVELIIGDLGDRDALVRLIGGCETVVHAAGAVRGNSQEDFDAVNVAGTSALLRSVRAQASEPHVLLLSSLTAREPQLSWYARSKAAAEALVRDTAQSWLVVRPPAVYGPGDREMLPVFKSMARGFAPVPGSLQARFSLVHVADLTDAILACLHCPESVGLTLTLCDGKAEGYSWPELAAEAGHVFGRRVRLWRVPHWLLNSAARVNVGLAGASGRKAMLTPPKLRELRHTDWVVDNVEITHSTGWEPAIPLREGLERLRVDL